MRGSHVLFPHGAAVCRWLAVLALGLLWLNAHARGESGRWTELEWGSQTSAGATATTKATGGNGPYTYSPATGGALQKGTKKLPWPGKNQATAMASWKAMATPRDMAKVMMNPIGGAITLLGSMASKQLIDAACVRVFGGVLETGAVWDQCHFVSQNVPVWGNPGYPSGYDSNEQAACTKTGQSYTATQGVVFHHATVRPRDETTRFCDVYRDVGGGSGSLLTVMILSQVGTTTEQVQDGYEAATPQVIEDKLTAKLGEWCQADFAYGYDGNSSKCATLLSELHAGGQTVPVDDPVLSGPVHVEGNCVTTKTITDAATGAYTLRTACTDSDYDYIGNQVKRTEVKKTSETPYNADGTQAGPTEETQEETKDEREVCEIDPLDPSCTGDRDVPSGEVPKSTRNLTYTPEDVGLGEGSCPAPVQIAPGKMFSYQVLCDRLVMFRPVLLAMAAFVAVLIVVGVGKEATG